VSSQSLNTSSSGFPAGNEEPISPMIVRKGSMERHVRARGLVILGGLLAGLAAYYVGESIYQVIPPKLVLQYVPLFRRQMWLPTLETARVATVRNSALTFGVLGVCLGGTLGVAGGLARRPASRAGRGGGLGALLGLVLGAGLPFALLPTSFIARARHADHDILISLLAHGLVWAPLGAAAGLAFAVGLGQCRLGQALVAGLMGAFLGAAAFELIGAAFFTLANTQEPISDTPSTRMMARLLVTLGTAMSVALVLPGLRDGMAADQTEPE
jgi:hypothetical protein